MDSSGQQVDACSKLLAEGQGREWPRSLSLCAVKDSIPSRQQAVVARRMKVGMPLAARQGGG